MGVFKEESSDSDGHHRRKEDSEEENNLLKYVTINNPNSISPQHKIKMGSLGNSSVMLKKAIIKGEDLQRYKKK